MRKELLEHTFKNKLTHVASALSQLDYIDELFTNKLVVPYEDKIVLGKVYGAQAYLLVWKKLGYMDNIDGIAYIAADTTDFVDYAEHTMGNALGVAAGMAMATDKKVWVNLSDAALQMGNTLEAIQFIGHNCINNVFVTVDYNGGQVTGNVDDILTVEPVIELFRGYGWDVEFDLKNFKRSSKPKVFIMRTKKGQGVRSMEQDIRKWHYKKIETIEELQSLVAELQGT